MGLTMQCLGDKAKRGEREDLGDLGRNKCRENKG